MFDERRLGIVLVLLFSGCGSPTATLDLLEVTQQGLAGARERQVRHHDRELEHWRKQSAALDAAFDADVRLAAAGNVRNAGGEVVELTPEWVISARKGYAAGRDLLAEQVRRSEANHAAAMDDLEAAEEALQLARQLTVLQWNVGERFKQEFLRLIERSPVHDD